LWQQIQAHSNNSRRKIPIFCWPQAAVDVLTRKQVPIFFFFFFVLLCSYTLLGLVPLRVQCKTPYFFSQKLTPKNTKTRTN
jgi:hypothetical protein